MGFIQQHLGKMILAGVAVVFIVLASLNYSGMCISESRYLTDREKYEAVLIKTIHRIEPGDGNISAPEYSNKIDFQKGCFVGQEVASRTKRRGTVRKRI
ncbi:MAG: hypothetical protein JKY31_13555, partial [Rhodobacteraceae bacterium]|nr:hypothetical protein [Paracoccaceae bacterium]